MDLLYEDRHLLIVHKPAGISTEPHLEEKLKKLLDSREKKPCYLRFIHRLDRWVEGVVLFAKSSKALTRFQELFHLRKVKKIYRAQVEGQIQGEGFLVDFLLKKEGHSVPVQEGVEGAKRAELFYRALDYRKGCTLLEIELQTGRYHQIRSQFASRDHPVLGDLQYGSSVNRGGVLDLCHVEFSCPYPILNGPLENLHIEIYRRIDQKRFGV